MCGRYVIGGSLFGLVLSLAPRIASASDLVVAVDPPSPVAAPTAVEEPGPPRKKRDHVEFAASLYAMTGTAMDDFEMGAIAFMVRPALELYVSIGLGDVSLMLGGTTLAIEVYAYEDRTSVNYPALFTLGLRHDRWLAEIAGGASMFTEDSVGPFELMGEQDPLPSPRAEVRAGARFMNLLELRGVLSAERRIAVDSSDLEHSIAERDSMTRYFAGVAFGIGGS